MILGYVADRKFLSFELLLLQLSTLLMECTQAFGGVLENIWDAVEPVTIL